MSSEYDPIGVIGLCWLVGGFLLVAGAAVVSLASDQAAAVLGLLGMAAGLLVALVAVVASGVRLGMAARAVDEFSVDVATRRP